MQSLGEEVGTHIARPRHDELVQEADHAILLELLDHLHYGIRGKLESSYDLVSGEQGVLSGYGVR